MRFSQGPIRGMTVEQATEKARGMWAKAPESVREKYAAREASLMTPGERRRQIAGIEPGMSSFSEGTRRATPGDLNGDGTPDNAVTTEDGRTYVPGKGVMLANGVYQQVSIPQYETGGKPGSPAATAGAGRGTPVKGAATPEENARARKVAEEASGQYGESAAMSQEQARAEIAGFYSTDKPKNPGIVAPPAAGTQPNGGAPSRSKLIESGAVAGAPAKPKIAAPLEAVQVGTGKNAGKINPLTGKPIGYVPPAQAIPAIERPASAGMSFDPKYGAVPKAREVPEAPMTAAEYDRVKASQDVNDVNALDPRSPEASAARGRMRDYEEQQRAAAAAVARRERTGPSIAERDAQQRAAARKLDRRVQKSYGAMDGGYLPTKSKA